MTVRDFVVLLGETENHTAKMLMDDWRETADPEHLERFLNQQLSMDALVGLRQCMSGMFAWRLSNICTEALFNRTSNAHVVFIFEFDEKAERCGFIITEKRTCVTFTEFMREEGLVQVTTEGVSLTPKGEEVAQQVRREIDGTD